MITSKEPVAWICATCGMQHEASHTPPESCAICLDERQYVGWGGQKWLSPAELADGREIVFREEEGVQTLHMEPGFAINQRIFLVPFEDGHLMWECFSLITDAAVERLKGMNIKGIAISHPHFYAAMVDWSDALGGVPIYLHAADRDWVQRRSANIVFWDGDRHALALNLSLVHLGGHFAGSAGLHWADGPHAGGALFPGDAIQVVMDRRYATFMYSYPNAIPHSPKALSDLEAKVAPLAYEDVFGYSRGRQIIGGGKAAVDASFARYRTAISA